MRNYDHSKSFMWNLKRETKEDIQNFHFNSWLYHNHRLICEAIITVTLLVFWLNYIFPLIEYEIEDTKIAIAVGGFVFMSLIATFYIIPYWITEWLFLAGESFYLVGVKIHSRLLRWRN